MLIHITPRFLRNLVTGKNVELIDLTIPEVGLHLKGGVDLVTCSPWPNKTYLTVSRRTPAKRQLGIMIDTDEALSEFTYIARWAVRNQTVVTHRVKFELIDNEFSDISDMVELWRSKDTGLSRCPDVYDGLTTMNLNPCMEYTPKLKRGLWVSDVVHEGRILERNEVFKVPTLERETLLTALPSHGLMPQPDIAFKANALVV